MGHKPMGNVTLRQVYAFLIRGKRTIPKVFTRFFLPGGVDGIEVFKKFNRLIFSNEARDVLYKIIHHILPAVKSRGSSLVND